MNLQEKHVVVEAFLGRLLTLKDGDFATFLNSDSKTLKSFAENLCLFWSNANDINSSGHVKFFKFLLRLCPAYNSTLSSQGISKTPKAVIGPKRFIEALFEPDPVGLMTYLYITWHTSAPELLLIIRDELFPQALTEQLKKCAHKNQSAQVIEFLEWACGSKFSASDLSLQERESILKRFEYESDDDFVEEADAPEKREPYDPVQRLLFSNYISNPSAFSRTSASRQSKARQALCDQTKLSHEQIEGWALMLERNPKKTRIIQDFIIAHGSANK